MVQSDNWVIRSQLLCCYVIKDSRDMQWPMTNKSKFIVIIWATLSAESIIAILYTFSDGCCINQFNYKKHYCFRAKMCPPHGLPHFRNSRYATNLARPVKSKRMSAWLILRLVKHQSIYLNESKPPKHEITQLIKHWIRSFNQYTSLSFMCILIKRRIFNGYYVRNTPVEIVVTVRQPYYYIALSLFLSVISWETTHTVRYVLLRNDVSLQIYIANLSSLISSI